MFGAEPQEKWTVQEATEFEAEAARDLHQKLIRAGWATAVFIGTVLAITPFLYGHSLHAYWERIGKYLVIVAMGELLWIVLWWGSSMHLGRAHERFGARWQTWSDCLQTLCLA